MRSCRHGNAITTTRPCWTNSRPAWSAKSMSTPPTANPFMASGIPTPMVCVIGSISASRRTRTPTGRYGMITTLTFAARPVVPAEIGLSGWDWQEKRSRWVGFDFDYAPLAHAEGLTEKRLEEINSAVQSIPWIEVRRSTSRGRTAYRRPLGHPSPPSPIPSTPGLGSHRAGDNLAYRRFQHAGGC